MLRRDASRSIPFSCADGGNERGRSGVLRYGNCAPLSGCAAAGRAREGKLKLPFEADVRIYFRVFDRVKNRCADFR